MKNKNGFTLVELLAVIAILAILVLIALPNVIGMVNKAKKSTFETQVRKVAQASQQKLFTSANSDSTFDCSDLLAGNNFSECTANVNGSEISIDAVGGGQYSNYLMVDVTQNANSGTLIDLNDLAEVKVNKEEVFKESLVKNGKINSAFKLFSADDYIDLSERMGYNATEEENNQTRTEFNAMLSKISYSGNNIVVNDEDSIMIIFSIKLPVGDYKIKSYFELQALNDEMIDEGNDNLNNDILDDIVTDSSNMFATAKLHVTKAQNYYFIANVRKDNNNTGFEIEKELGEETLKLVGNEEVTIKVNDVKNYKDEGIINNGKVLNANEYYSYNNLTSKAGTYKYTYVVKTNDGIKKFTRNINVTNYTDSRCFAFNNGTIEHYYYYIDNDKSKGRCPMDVVIPEKINGVTVREIGDDAFTIGCDSNIVTPSYSTPVKMSCSVSGMGITSVFLPSTIEIIGARAFYGNNLREITIPDSVTSIGGWAFGQNQLQKVEFNNTKNMNTNCRFYGEKNSSSVNKEYTCLE